MKYSVFKSLTFTIAVIIFSAFTINAQSKEQDSTSDTGLRQYQMEEMVIEGVIVKDTPQEVPKNVTVLTDLDIEFTPGKNLTDLFSGKASVNIRSYSGNDKQSAIDIRGMGISSGSNVLIVVDGIKLNAPDLSGADISSIPLDEIERIEIIRGSGSVVFGDGAVGGVINIFTKKGKKKPTLSIKNSVGSYETLDSSVNYKGKKDKLDFSISVANYTTEGYRDNGFLQKKNAGAQLGYELTDTISLILNTTGYIDTYGMPGPVSKSDISSRVFRIQSSAPEDAGETTDKRAVGGIKIDLGNQGRLEALRGYRFRDNTYILGYSPLISKTDQTNTINEESKTLNINYTLDYHLNGYKHVFQWGLDTFESQYISTALAQNKRNNSTVNNKGLFVMNRWFLSRDLNIQLGLRQSQYEGLFRKDLRKSISGKKIWENGDLSSKTWDNTAYDAGVVYSLTPEFNLFGNTATSFRAPNVDEFALADEELTVQQGNHIDIGFHYLKKDLLEFSTTLFNITLNNEIYYGKDTSGNTLNRNYDEQTQRYGVETEFKFYPSDSLFLTGNATLMKAVFGDKGTSIPLVPEQKLSLSAELLIGDHIVLVATGTHVGERFDGNDQENTNYDKLAAYQVVDTKLTYDMYKNRKFYVGIKNLFDTLYSTIAYSETYYPMPTRSFFCGIDWEF